MFLMWIFKTERSDIMENIASTIMNEFLVWPQDTSVQTADHVIARSYAEAIQRYCEYHDLNQYDEWEHLLVVEKNQALAYS